MTMLSKVVKMMTHNWKNRPLNLEKLLLTRAPNLNQLTLKKMMTLMVTSVIFTLLLI